MNSLAMNIRIQKKLDDIKHILIKVYDYSSEEAYKYADRLIEEYKSEAIQLPIPNNIYISNKLDERIKDLQTGTDFGVNISKMSMRLEEIVKKLEDEWKRNGIGGDEMDNTVSSKINPNYKMHVLVKYECLECDKSFILSKKYVDDLKGIDVSCPYCDSYNVEDTVIMDDPEELEALGCMGIGHVEEERKGSPMIVMKRAYLFKPEGVDSTVVTKKELIHGAKEEDFKEITLCIDIDTMREWVTEQSIIDQEEDYEVIDDRY